MYQDIFQEGSFIGKGIYDVEAFQRALHGRFPENIVLSHDLLEACHARSAIVSDVELYEDADARGDPRRSKPEPQQRQGHARMGEIERAWELFALLNPVHHVGTPEQIAVYKVEPYVVRQDTRCVTRQIGLHAPAIFMGVESTKHSLTDKRLIKPGLQIVFVFDFSSRKNCQFTKAWEM